MQKIITILLLLSVSNFCQSQSKKHHKKVIKDSTTTSASIILTPLTETITDGGYYLTEDPTGLDYFSNTLINPPQEKYDTVLVVRQVSDTTTISIPGTVREAQDPSQPMLQRDKGWMLSNNKVFWVKLYSVREKHNTGENNIDPGGVICMDNRGRQVSCFHDYWVHVKYLTLDRKPLTGILVWSTKPEDEKN